MTGDLSLVDRLRLPMDSDNGRLVYDSLRREAADRIDELEAKCERQEALLREALRWCPKKPLPPPESETRLYKRWQAMTDLGNRIDAELGGKP